MIYFLLGCSTGLVKVGTTKDLKTRARTLASQGGQRLKLLLELEGGHIEERALHLRFAADRVIGEWFRPDPLIANFISLEKLQRSYAAMYARDFANRIRYLNSDGDTRRKAFDAAEQSGDPIEGWMLGAGSQ